MENLLNCAAQNVGKRESHASPVAEILPDLGSNLVTNKRLASEARTSTWMAGQTYIWRPAWKSHVQFFYSEGFILAVDTLYHSSPISPKYKSAPGTPILPIFHVQKQQAILPTSQQPTNSWHVRQRIHPAENGTPNNRLRNLRRTSPLPQPISALAPAQAATKIPKTIHARPRRKSRV